MTHCGDMPDGSAAAMTDDSNLAVDIANRINDGHASPA